MKAFKKKCTKCEHFKGLSAFPIRLSKGKKRIHSWCIKCRNLTEKRRKAKVRKHRGSYFRAYHAKNRSKQNQQMLDRYYRLRDVIIQKRHEVEIYHPELLKTPCKPI